MKNALTTGTGTVLATTLISTPAEKLPALYRRRADKVAAALPNTRADTTQCDLLAVSARLTIAKIELHDAEKRLQQQAATCVQLARIYGHNNPKYLGLANAALLLHLRKIQAKKLVIGQLQAAIEKEEDRRIEQLIDTYGDTA